MNTHLTSRCLRAFRGLLTGLVISTLLAADPPLALLRMTGRIDGGADLTFQVRGDPGPKRLDGSRDLQTWEPVGVFHNDAEFEESVIVPAIEGHRFFRVQAQLVASPNELGARIAELTSSSVRLAWTPPAGATGIRVYLAPEPGVAAEANPARKLVATLPGETGEFQAVQLAASVDAFFCLEADTPAGLKSALIHARTPSSPRTAPRAGVQLVPSLREVQGFAPNILCVTLANWPTNRLKEGWTVTRAGGAPIPVIAVHRHSVPVGAPAYNLGFLADGDDYHHRGRAPDVPGAGRTNRFAGVAGDFRT